MAIGKTQTISIRYLGEGFLRSKNATKISNSCGMSDYSSTLPLALFWVIITLTLYYFQFRRFLADMSVYLGLLIFAYLFNDVINTSRLLVAMTQKLMK